MVWTVHKFGGTSVADAACVRRVAGIIAKRTRQSRRRRVGHEGRYRRPAWPRRQAPRAASRVDAQLKALRERHERSAVDLLGAAGAKPVLAQFERELEDIQSILKALSLRPLGVAAQP